MIELGLQRISRLLANRPLPWRAIHVAGTNGKGSICAYISAMLDIYNNSNLRRHAGDPVIRHGRFNSPHLVDRWDCISIDQKTVSASVFHQVEKDVLRRNVNESIDASEFELLTATAFEIFTLEQLDVAVVEVGMGGRLDATNIIGETEGLHQASDVEYFRPPPLVTAFSSIGLDHQEFLGNTLEAIAQEKAGILKCGVPVVYDWSNPQRINDIIHSMAVERNCPSPFWSDNGTRTSFVKDMVHRAQQLGVSSLTSAPAHVRSNLTVAFQATSSALATLGRIQRQDESTEEASEDLERDMLAVVGSTQFPGRQHEVQIEYLTGRRQPVLIDGAHNEQSSLALAAAVEKLRGDNASNGSVTWILGASSTKDVKQILSPLIKNDDAIFAAEFGPVDGMPWVKPLVASAILGAAKEVVSDPGALYVEDCGTDVELAIRKASDKAAERPLVITGSLYLVGDVFRLLRDHGS